MSFKFITICALYVASTNLFAATWSMTSISYLYGQGYKISDDQDEKYSIYTFEHASGWKYGDNFFFTDVSGAETDSAKLYMEWAPRISSKKTVGAKYSGVLKDVLLAGQLNVAPNIASTQLIGIGIDFNLPGFNFFQFNLYHRDNRNLSSTTYQATLVWELPFSIASQNFTFGGFADFAGEEDTAAANTLVQPQLLWKPISELGVGIEYQYWQNKFGIEGRDESTPQVIVKWML